MAQPTKMPFPGESPTISLAMAAGEKFGFHEEADKPKKSAKRAKPKKSAARKSASPSRGGARAGTKAKKSR